MNEEDVIDKSNMAAMLEDFPNQLLEALKLGKDVEIENPDKISKIFWCGMGGSAISGDILRTYLEKNDIPIFVNRDYKLPKFADENSLVIIVSYSGNTEESVASYRDAFQKKLRTLSISSGGKLKDLCMANRTPHIRVPENIPPRLATGYLLVPVINVLQNASILPRKEKEILATAELLKKDQYKKMGKDLAERIGKKIPIIYSSNRFLPVAMKWKTDINENAKIHAFYNLYSEYNHNEICGYTNLNGDYYVIIMKDEEDYGRIRKRMRITKELIKKSGADVIELAIRGDSMLMKLLSAIYMGTWASYFLALQYETDPTPVEIIENLKKELK